MKTVTWADLFYVTVPGEVAFQGRHLFLLEEHIDRWREDPAGRYSLIISTDDVSEMRLGRFYPSL